MSVTHELEKDSVVLQQFLSIDYLELFEAQQPQLQQFNFLLFWTTNNVAMESINQLVQVLGYVSRQGQSEYSRYLFFMGVYTISYTLYMLHFEKYIDTTSRWPKCVYFFGRYLSYQLSTTNAHSRCGCHIQYVQYFQLIIYSIELIKQR